MLQHNWITEKGNILSMERNYFLDLDGLWVWVVCRKLNTDFCRIVFVAWVGTKLRFFGVHTKLKSLHFTTLMFRYLLIDTHWKYRICQGAQHTLAIINLNLTWSREVRLSDIIITNRRLICFSYSFNSVTLPKIFFQWLISPAAHVNELYETFRLQVNT